MKEKISPFQFFAAVFFVPYGTAAILFLTPNAKQDSWLVIIMYMLPALLLQSIYITLYRRYPQDTLITWLPKIFGRLVGKVLSGLYIIYFAYIATRVLRDIVGILSKTAMFGIPLWILTIVSMITVTYGVYTGVENTCRIASTYFVFLILLITALIILYFATPNIIEWKNLLPILPEGIVDAVVNNWRLITFPYGETIIATMLYVHVNEPKKIKKAAFAAIIVEGIILALVHMCYVIGLGPNFASKELFPLMDALRLIRVSGFLDRLDLFAIVVIVFNGFIKIGFFMYAAAAGAAQFLGIKNEQPLVIPFGIIISVLSAFIGKSFPKHLNIGLDITPKYIHLPFQIVIPILALIMYYIRNGFKNKTIEQSKNQCPRSNS